MTKKLYGYYSKLHDDMFDHSIWLDANLNEVKISIVDQSQDLDEIKKIFLWEDAVPIGEVIRQITVNPQVTAELELTNYADSSDFDDEDIDDYDEDDYEEELDDEDDQITLG